MSQNEFKVQFLNRFLGKLPDVGFRCEISSPVVRYIGEGQTDFDYSVSCHTACSPAEFELALHNEIRLLGSRQRKTMEWKVYELQSASFESRILNNNNFRLKQVSRLRYASVNLDIAAAKNVLCRSVESEDDFETLLDINEAAFEDRAEWLNRSLRIEIRQTPDLVRAYIGSIDGIPSCTGWIKIYNKVGFLYGGGTVPTMRGLGAYRSLVAARAQFARQRGVQFMVSECSPESDKILAGLGFLDGGSVEKWVL